MVRSANSKASFVAQDGSHHDTPRGGAGLPQYGRSPLEPMMDAIRERQTIYKSLLKKFYLLREVKPRD